MNKMGHKEMKKLRNVSMYWYDYDMYMICTDMIIWLLIWFVYDYTNKI